jgi:hypothetical protein
MSNENKNTTRGGNTPTTSDENRAVSVEELKAQIDFAGRIHTARKPLSLKSQSDSDHGKNSLTFIYPEEVDKFQKRLGEVFEKALKDYVVENRANTDEEIKRAGTNILALALADFSANIGKKLNTVKNDLGTNTNKENGPRVPITIGSDEITQFTNSALGSAYDNADYNKKFIENPTDNDIPELFRKLNSAFRGAVKKTVVAPSGHEK